MSVINKTDILQTTEKQVESQLTPDNRANYLKIVVAGMKYGMHGGANGIMGHLADSKDPIHDCAVGAANVVLILRKEAKGVMPIKAMVPAGLTLMIKALSVVDKLGLMPIGNAEVDKATTLYTNYMLKSLKVSAPMLKTAMVNVHGIINDPTKMEAIKRKAGVVKDPRASEPTPLPGGDNEPA